MFNNNKLDEKEWPDQPQYFIKNLKNTKILYFASDMAPWEERGKNADSSCDLCYVNYFELDQARRAFQSWWDKDFTVGAGVIFLCLIAGIKPHLYGFDIADNICRSHYWENRPQEGSSHSVTNEKLWLRQLVKDGYVTYH